MKLSSNQTYHLIQTYLKWDLMIINLATLVMIQKVISFPAMWKSVGNWGMWPMEIRVGIKPQKEIWQ